MQDGEANDVGEENGDDEGSEEGTGDESEGRDEDSASGGGSGSSETVKNSASCNFLALTKTVQMLVLRRTAKKTKMMKATTMKAKKVARIAPAAVTVAAATR